VRTYISATCHQSNEGQQVKSCCEESLKLSHFWFNLLFAESQQTKKQFVVLSINVYSCFWLLLFFFSLYTALPCIQTHTTSLHICIHSCSAFHSTLPSQFIHFRKTPTLPTMASSSNPKKRTKRVVLKKVKQVDNSETSYLERWFSGN